MLYLLVEWTLSQAPAFLNLLNVFARILMEALFFRVYIFSSKEYAPEY